MTPRRSVIPIFIPHLGCPRDCVFCNQRSIASQTVPSSSDVSNIIDTGLSRGALYPEVAFYGGSFTAISEDLQLRYLEAAYSYVERGLVSGIRISTRPDYIDVHILETLRARGVKTIELGAQSMDNKVLKMSARGHSMEDTTAASNLIRQFDFELILQMMVGLPGETSKTPMMNAHEIARLRPDGVRIYPVVVVEGTALADMWRAGSYVPLTVYEAVPICADIMGYFESENIPVIRVGLNPTEELKAEVLAGVYHPAFGELCMTELAYRSCKTLLTNIDIPAKATVTFGVGKGSTSIYLGQRRKNADRLVQEFGLGGLKVKETLDGKLDVVILAFS